MSEYVLARIEAIQQELEELRKVVAYQVEGPRHKAELKGLWRGLRVSEEDLQEAQRAVFRDAYTFG